MLSPLESTFPRRIWVIALGLTLACQPGPPLPATGAGLRRPPHPGEVVVILHGLARGPASMRALQRTLESAGYRVENLKYPSRSLPIATLVRRHLTPRIRSLERELLEDSSPGTPVRIHFVTHSLGGILVRFHCKEYRSPYLGRVVMLAPPNQGSELVDRLGGMRLFRWVNGPVGRQLGTDGVPGKLGPVDFELGVIAGTRSWNPLFSWLIPGRDDGKVSVERARVEGMSDFLEVPASHTFLMDSREVQEATLRFLQTGSFDGSSRAPQISR